jgi:UDP-N-acetylmuramate--alanine ligase
MSRSARVPDRDALDLSTPRTIHIVAIGGAGMSAIARYLHALGHRVSGSDQRHSKLLDRLASEGITTFVGHAAEHVPPACDAVAISTAVRDTNVEVVAARGRGIPVLSRADVLRLVVATSPKAIAVSGTHGKTTTTGMVTAALRAGGLHPSFIAGGVVVDLGTNTARDSGDWMVVEADESDGTFLRLPRDAVIVTNIEADHLDRWGTFDALVQGFEEFVAAAPGPRVVCVDDPVAARLAAATNAVTYGFSDSARYRAGDYGGIVSGSQFDLHIDGRFATSIWLRMHGRHNALNATGAAALALELGVPLAAVHQGLTEFGGMARRFELRGGGNGAALYDDYAHTASEIVATLALAREVVGDVIEDEPVVPGSEPFEPGRLVAVCQPHRYTRISRHWREFGDAFVDADLVVVTGLDGASEDPIPGVTGELVANAVRERHPETPVVYLPEWDELRDLPWRFGRPGDVIVTLGCGDITRVHDDWLAEGVRRGEPV